MIWCIVFLYLFVHNFRIQIFAFTILKSSNYFRWMQQICLFFILHYWKMLTSLSLSLYDQPNVTGCWSLVTANYLDEAVVYSRNIGIERCWSIWRFWLVRFHTEEFIHVLCPNRLKICKKCIFQSILLVFTNRKYFGCINIFLLRYPWDLGWLLASKEAKHRVAAFSFQPWSKFCR